jgi:hypothetical protein
MLVSNKQAESIIENLYFDEDQENGIWKLWNYNLEKPIFLLTTFDVTQEPHFLILAGKPFIIGVDKHSPNMLGVCLITPKSVKSIWRIKLTGKVKICGILKNRLLVLHDRREGLILYDLVKRNILSVKNMQNFQKSIYMEALNSLLIITGPDFPVPNNQQQAIEEAEIIYVLNSNMTDLKQMIKIPVLFEFRDFTYQASENLLTVVSERGDGNSSDEDEEEENIEIRSCSEQWKLEQNSAELKSVVHRTRKLGEDY